MRGLRMRSMTWAAGCLLLMVSVMPAAAFNTFDDEAEESLPPEQVSPSNTCNLPSESTTWLKKYAPLFDLSEKLKTLNQNFASIPDTMWGAADAQEANRSNAFTRFNAAAQQFDGIAAEGAVNTKEACKKCWLKEARKLLLDISDRELVYSNKIYGTLQHSSTSAKNVSINALKENDVWTLSGYVEHIRLMRNLWKEGSKNEDLIKEIKAEVTKMLNAYANKTDYRSKGKWPAEDGAVIEDIEGYSCEGFNTLFKPNS